MIPQARFDDIEERGSQPVIPQSTEGDKRPDHDGQRLAGPAAQMPPIRVMLVRQIRSSMGAVVHVESAARMLWSSLPRTQPPGMWQSCYEGGGRDPGSAWTASDGQAGSQGR